MHREFVYIGDPVPELNEQEHAAFLMNIQKSILLSLEKRKLLTHSQRERCLVELEKQYSREQKADAEHNAWRFYIAERKNKFAHSTPHSLFPIIKYSNKVY